MDANKYHKLLAPADPEQACGRYPLAVQHPRLPMVHSLLGRIYSDREWEALCDRCGNCCFDEIMVDGKRGRSAIPCRFLDPVDNNCRVYGDRFAAEADCTRVTPSVVLQGRLPPDCNYVAEMNRIIEEDHQGMDPNKRRSRHRHGGRDRRRERRRGEAR
ncbi:MAG: hypothetical protein VX498_03590 [Myxococcota bacterium]|nr:hypothetical protein [Myxococcota bacterium]